MKCFDAGRKLIYEFTVARIQAKTTSCSNDIFKKVHFKDGFALKNITC